MTPEAVVQITKKEQEPGEIQNSAHVWASILKGHPEISDVVLAYYTSPGRRDKVKKYKTSHVLKFLVNGTYPTPADQKPSVDKSICSISSIVATNTTSNTEPDKALFILLYKMDTVTA